MIELKMLNDKIATEGEIQAIKDKIKIEMEEAIDFAENSPLPLPEELYTDNYVQKDYPFILD
jgi:pyruvate dehydrogenase E1 component alpha subunit